MVKAQVTDRSAQTDSGWGLLRYFRASRDHINLEMLVPVQGLEFEVASTCSLLNASFGTKGALASL